MSGWKIDNIHITVRQRLCEALYAAGHTERAGESLLEMVNSFDEEVYTNKLTTEWVSGESILSICVVPCVQCFSADFTQQCLSTFESDGDAVSTPTQDTTGATVHATPTPLLREWAKAKLAHDTWKDALLSAVGVSITFCFRVYP